MLAINNFAKNDSRKERTMTTRAGGADQLAICDRCRMTFKHSQLMKDPNALGLRVCKDCKDQFNPYRLPVRQCDPIALPWVRPMVHLVAPRYLITEEQAISPAQAKQSYIEVEQDTAIQATGNTASPITEFPLPNIEYDYPAFQDEKNLEERLSPRMQKLLTEE